MSRILFVTFDGGGNQRPALGIARELAIRGHTVAFLGHESQRQWFRVCRETLQDVEIRVCKVRPKTNAATN